MYVRPRPRFRPRNAGSGNTPSLALEFNQLSTLPSYVTFSRGTQAMQYGSDGTLQYAPNNLLTYSNQADNAAWTKSNSFVQQNLATYSENISTIFWGNNGVSTTTGLLSPNNTATATLLVGNGASSNHIIFSGVTATGTGGVAASIYAKAGTNNFFQVFFNTDSAPYANFDLSNGTVGSVGATTTGSIQNIGNGWYRCVAYTTSTTANGIGIALISATTDGRSPANTLSTSVYLWGAQLVQGSVPGDYVATTSAALPCLYADYNGALRARKLCEDAAVTTTHWVFQSITTIAATYTVSEVMKAGERTWALIRIRDSSGNDRFAWFNLAAGTIGSVQTNLTASMVSLGSGWYRCSVTVSAAVAAANPCVFGPVTGDGVATYTGDGSSGIYIADAQLTPGYLPLAVTETTSAAVYGPRFDYDPVTKVARGLLIEEQRANLLLQSNDFQTSWSPTNITRTPNSILSPEGVVNGVKIEATATATAILYQQITATSTFASLSVYVKQGTGATTANTFGIRNFTTAINLVFGNLNYSTGVFTYTVGSTGVVIRNAGNGWWRVEISVSAGITAGDLIGGYVGLTGGVATAGDFLYAYGAQLEAGAFATSYIPTVGSTATRNADSATIPAGTWYNTAAGTWYFNGETQTFPRYLIVDNSGTAKYPMYVHSAAGGIGNFDGTNLTLTGNNTTARTTFKAATTYSGSIATAVLNGGTVATGTYNGAFSTIATFKLGGATGAGGEIDGHIQSIRFYPTALSSVSQQSITA